jgi:hypothetical protein
MALPGACILSGNNGGEFAFDCLTGSIHGVCEGERTDDILTGLLERETQPRE